MSHQNHKYIIYTYVLYYPVSRESIEKNVQELKLTRRSELPDDVDVLLESNLLSNLPL